MFSGIRYILGYADETDTAGLAAGPANEATQFGSQQNTNATSVLKSDIISTTNVLEQTLNAATTKLTEQLMPQQASIEQLQSSSHQLLPSIIEQHESEENRKLSLERASKVSLEFEGGEEDDINVDSWELLDLVDKAEDVGARSSLIMSSVQKDEVTVTTQATGISKSTSGILKPSGIGSCSSGKTNDNDNNLQARQKQKVSFETPDLVKYKQEIEQTKPKPEQEEVVATPGVVVVANEVDSAAANSPVSDSKRNKRNKKVKKSKALSVNSQVDKSCKLEVKVGVDAKSNKDSEFHRDSEQNVTENKSSTPSAAGNGEGIELVSQVVCNSSAAKEMPVLNYAKALSAKPRANITKDVGEAEGVHVAVHAGKSESVKSAIIGSQLAATDGQSGPVKRSRPLSTSSWSSNDDFEPIDRGQSMVAEKLSCVVAAGQSFEDVNQGPANQDLMDDDNESLVSSGFSDCDYGFSGLNDYIMRPKKAHYKKAQSGPGSGNSSSIVGMKSRRSDRSNSSVNKMTQSARGATRPPTVTEAKLVQPTPSPSSMASSKNTKPKKKRMIMMTTSKMVTASCSEFLKQKRQQDSRSKAFENKQASRNGSSESSDIAEMDESWFVTPPPCFTGATQMGKQIDLPKAKEAARENALIEHPSVYIASTSKDSLKVKFTARSSSSPKESQREFVETNGKKNFVALEDSAWASDDEDNLSETMLPDKPSNLIDVGQAELQPVGSFYEIRDDKDVCSDIGLKEEEDSEEEPLPEFPQAPISSVAGKVSNAPETRVIENTRPAIQVRPIEPERRPGWQLKRQRSKRRSLVRVSTTAATIKQDASEPRPSPETDRSSASSSPALSSRSTPTPTLIDRIGTSIVANLTNLTNGLVSSGAMNYRPNGRDPNMLNANSDRASHQSPLANKTNSLANVGQMSRKHMSKRSLKRQNDCAKQGNSLRRPDRRLKMFTTPNGCSVNRKVHTSIH